MSPDFRLSTSTNCSNGRLPPVNRIWHGDCPTPITPTSFGVARSSTVMLSESGFATSRYSVLPGATAMAPGAWPASTVCHTSVLNGNTITTASIPSPVRNNCPPSALDWR